jgi:cytochrome c biogenesis protein CcmG/thiol:disulfide interchange protein DsbE
MTRRAWIGAAFAAAAIVAAVVAGVIFAHDTSDTAPAVGVELAEAVSFSGTDPVTGKAVALADFRGNPVVINVWASWCPGCVAEAADLRRFAEAHPEAQVIGVDFQDTEPGARDFYREWGWTWPSVFDPNGAIAAQLGLQGLPTTLFLDRKHRVVARITGESDFDGFEDGLEQALASS